MLNPSTSGGEASLYAQERKPPAHARKVAGMPWPLGYPCILLPKCVINVYTENILDNEVHVGNNLKVTTI